MTMETITMVWSIMGFIAFITLFSLRDRVIRLERQLSDCGNSRQFQSRDELGDRMREYIGKRIILGFYEDEEDIDVLTYAENPRGGVTVIDCDEKWVLVRIDTGKKSLQKLLRINSIKDISSVIPDQETSR